MSEMKKKYEQICSQFRVLLFFVYMEKIWYDGMDKIERMEDTFYVSLGWKYK